MRDYFTAKTKEVISKRASFVCSNPNCRGLTLACSEVDSEKIIYVGNVSHITGASKGGPRYDPTLTSDQRKSSDNGIFLCSNCAEMIDKNQGLDFPIKLLREWKEIHEKWIKNNLNKSITNLCEITIVEGEYLTMGESNVIGFDINSPTVFKPGTKSITLGKENVTGVRIRPKKVDK